MFGDVITRLIRTYVPIVAGLLVANIPGLDSLFDTDALVAFVMGAYYGLAAFLESKVHPLFGYLLGVPKSVE